MQTSIEPATAPATDSPAKVRTSADLPAPTTFTPVPPTKAATKANESRQQADSAARVATRATWVQEGHDTRTGPTVAKVTGKARPLVLVPGSLADTAHPLRLHKEPAFVPDPSPTPDALHIVAHQENTLKGACFLGPGLKHYGPHQAAPIVPATVMTKGAREPTPGLSLAGALAKAPKVNRAATVAAMMHKATKRNPVLQAPADLAHGAYLPLFPRVTGAVALAARATVRANEALAVALAAQLCPPGADGPTKARAKKHALRLMSGGPVPTHIEPTKGSTPGNVDQDSPLASALRPISVPAAIHGKRATSVLKATIKGRHHFGRVPVAATVAQAPRRAKA